MAEKYNFLNNDLNITSEIIHGKSPELEKFTVQNENGLSTSITLEDIEYPEKINDTLFSIQLEINKSKRKN